MRCCTRITSPSCAARAESRRAVSALNSATSSCTICTSPLVAHAAQTGEESAGAGQRAARASAPGSLRRDEVVAAGRDLELVTAVLGVRGLVVARIERPLLAIGDDVDPGGVHALVLQVALGRGGAAIAQRQIVLVGAALVGMTADRDLDLRDWPAGSRPCGRAWPGRRTARPPGRNRS